MIDRTRRYFAYAEEYFEGMRANLEKFSDAELIRYVAMLERYKFKARSKTDLPHANSTKNHLERKRGDCATPRGLARITLRMMDPHYNSNTSNNIRKSYVQLVKESFFKS
ncbi:MAG: hypothetical protein KKC19_02300 [Nanoarchaeota archaeon]|nr:hypothetical protein [Nanoarchaeota archaeon]